MRVLFALSMMVSLAATARAQLQIDGLRTIQFETTQVTAPDVAVSPDGEWLIFTMLGKLFRLSVNGGEAEQLTFGPYYDNDPVISPDGRLVAFQSDRDGSEGNIFVLTLATRKITQLTQEPWADRPSWAPDGQSLVYLRLERRPRPLNTLSFLTPNEVPVLVRRIRLVGGEAQTLHTGPGNIRSPFHLPDGRVGWAILLYDSSTLQWKTRIEVKDEDGSVSTLHVFDGAADPVVPGHRAGGLYARTADGIYPRDFTHQIDVLFAPLPAGPEQRIAGVSGELAAFGVAADDTALYLGNLGHLWKVRLPRGQREVIAFRAKVTLTIRDPEPPRRWAPVEPGTAAAPRRILYPRLSPDGARLLFSAGQSLWEQPLNGEPVRQLSDAAVNEEPVFSPDGRRIAFVTPDAEEVRVIDLDSGRIRTVAVALTFFDGYLNWSHDGQLLVFVDHTEEDGYPHRVMAANVSDASTTIIADGLPGGPGLVEADGPLQADGQLLYFVRPDSAGTGTLFSLSLDDVTEREPIMQIADFVPTRVSADGKWLALTRRNHLGIWLAPLGAGRVEESDIRLLTPEGDRDFAFTPDGSALLYVVGNTLWRQPLGGGAREVIPIRLELLAPTPPPVLLQRVRVLDFAAGFGVETSLLIERGRIRWIGLAQGRELPSGTVTVDAGGRFAVPGLFDMHGHGSGCGGAARIAYGVTSVRNMGGSLAGQNAHADLSDFTSDAIPRCFYSGRYLEGQHGVTGAYSIHLMDKEDARTHVRLWQARGAQFIKLYQHLPWALQRAAADEAHRIGLPVAAHGITLEHVVKGVTLGYASLTHWERFYDDALQMFGVAGTRWDPNLGHRSGIEVGFRDDPERFHRATPVGALRLFGDLALKGAWAEMLRTTGAAYRRGITLLPGTDGGPRGLALQWELEFFAEAGIPPLDVLRFATQASAETVGAGDDLGTLEVGKLADIVLLDANPLDDIKNTQTIWRVIKGGWVFDPEELRPSRN